MRRIAICAVWASIGACLLAPPALAAPPANDQVAGAVTIPAGGPFPYSAPTIADITDATTTGDPPTPSCPFSASDLSRSVWYKFTPSTAGHYTLTTAADQGSASTVDDTLIAVYTSPNPDAPPFTELPTTGAQDGCDDDSATTENFQSTLSTNLNAGTSYYVVVWDESPGAPTAGNTAMQLLVKMAPFVDPPANDQAPGALTIPVPAGTSPSSSPLVADISAATDTGDPPLHPSCQPSPLSRSTWFKFTPTDSSGYTLSTAVDQGSASTVDDTVMAVYTSSGGSSGPFTELPSTGLVDGCDDDSATNENLQSTLSTNLQAGTDYYVVVWKFGTTPPAVGNTAVQVVAKKIPTIVRPPGDKVGDAPLVELNQTYSGTTFGASHDYGLVNGSCFSTAPGGGSTDSAPGLDVVLRFRAPTDGSYSFHVRGTPDTSVNSVLYLASAAPPGPTP
ncbi:MAG: hypothetical protein QOG63_2859, partial [Thermoleophilaceae bacterium]|nr:hypothetical protein [Thermoleophilaceae bacterium]